MERLTLTLACGPYDRTEALRTGEVRPSGIDLVYLSVKESRQAFSRMVKNNAFDLAEMSCAYYLGRKVQGGFPFVALPVFPSRRFRHGFVFVNAASGIETPKDLDGKRIGVPEYRVTAAVWVRGILRDEYGVDLRSVRWFEGGLNEPKSTQRIASSSLVFEMADPVDIEPIPAGDSMSDMLARGALDALISPRVPDSLSSSRMVRRLFPDHVEAEREYYGSTGIFPIMHTVVMKESLFERHPWVAESIYDAFVEARNVCWELYHRSGALKTMLPWQHEATAEADDLFGSDFWAYGLEPNRKTLETLMRYLVQQGFLADIQPIDGLFAPVVELNH
ncbi:MAG: ABC transporter substrate-binding protein [Acidimicrobiia bacterium]|nr:ABC transporter substrate-binding protein [Acidimicrobiia bacterium]